jgi:beta-lactamase regulating signal transducer with metallopeptidase domain/HEAT repeat protein
MTRISELLLNFAINATWQIPVIFAVAALGAFSLRNAAARYRYGLWLATLMLSLLGPLWTISEFSTSALPTPSTINLKQSVSRPPIIQEAATPTTSAPETSAGSSHLLSRRRQVVNTSTRWLSALSIVYALFVLFRICRLARQWRSQLQLRESAIRPALRSVEAIAQRCRTAMEVKGIQVFCSPLAVVPATLGARNPIIVLPDNLVDEAEEETLVSVIGHEMAHVSRRDFATNLICELVCLPISFHPLTYFIKRRIHQNRELACDELVTQRLLAPQAYARSLVRVAQTTMARSEVFIMGMYDGSALEERIMKLTQRKRRLALHVARPLTAVVLCVLGAVMFSLSGFSFDLRSYASQSFVPASPVRVASTPEPPEPIVASAHAGQSGKPSVDSPNAQQRAQAACAAGRRHAVEEIPTLILMLGDDSPTELLRCWDTGSWSPALQTFKHPSPGEQAALALASMGRTAFEPLANQLDNKNSTVVRNAAWAIGELTAMPPGSRASAVPQLTSLLSDEDEWVRMAAARALGELRDERATERLLVTLSDSDWRVRALATWALSEMKDARAVKALCYLLLSDSQAQVRRGAAEALGEIRSPEAMPSLQQALNDPETSVRAKVAWAIKEIEG